MAKTPEQIYQEAYQAYVQARRNSQNQIKAETDKAETAKKTEESRDERFKKLQEANNRIKGK